MLREEQSRGLELKEDLLNCEMIVSIALVFGAYLPVLISLEYDMVGSRSEVDIDSNVSEGSSYLICFG